MQNSQQSDKMKIFRRASRQQRLLATTVFLALAASFGLLHLAATNRIDIGRWLNPCGFKQRFNLPCPTCGMTTSALAFARGQILQSFYIQPAAAMLCGILVIVAFLAFFTAVFGVYFQLLVRIKLKYVILVLVAIIAAGWMVTLARALAVNTHK
jgi:hypothetical protein